jgi:phage terminase Nu1 subunit (DNA packaging protein)
MARKKDAPGVDSGALAQLFDCTTRQIELLAKRGICVKLGHGRYNAPASIRNYIRHLREQAASRAGIDASTDTAGANVKLKETNTKLLQLRYDKQANNLIEVQIVRDGWGRIMRAVRQLVLGLPGKIAFEVPTLTLHDRAAIERICRDDLEDAALDRGYDVAARINIEDDVSDSAIDDGDDGASPAAAEVDVVGVD